LESDEQSVQRAEKKSRRERGQQLVLEFLSFVCRSTKDIKLKDDKFVESFNEYYHPDVITKEFKECSLADVLRIVFTCELKLPTAYASGERPTTVQEKDYLKKKLRKLLSADVFDVVEPWYLSLKSFDYQPTFVTTDRSLQKRADLFSVHTLLWSLASDYLRDDTLSKLDELPEIPETSEEKCRRIDEVLLQMFTLVRAGEVQAAKKFVFLRGVDWERLSHGKDDISNGKAYIAYGFADVMLNYQPKALSDDLDEEEQLDIYKSSFTVDDVNLSNAQEMVELLEERSYSSDYGWRAAPLIT